MLDKFHGVRRRKISRRAALSLVTLSLLGAVLVPEIPASATVPTGWGVSYANPGVSFQATDLNTATMTTETADSISSIPVTVAGLGTFSGTGSIVNNYTWGGAGGTGKYFSAGDITLTLSNTQRYIGFWWSAGNSDNNVELLNGTTSLGVFTAADLVSILGDCPSTDATRVNTDYCGNPNYSGDINADPAKDEQFAYIHIRHAPGFNKIRFYGTGFEFDNVSVSQTIPENSTTETAVTTSSVRTSCSSVTSTSATSTLTACPRTIYIRKNQSFTYNPLTDTQISGYSYPADVTVFNTYIFNGTGTQSLSGNNISLQSSAVGTYRVDFTIARGTARDTSRITIIVTELNPIFPDVLLIDPQKTSTTPPAINLQASANTVNVYLCAKFVTSASNSNALASTNSAISGITLSNTGTGITATGTNNSWAFLGSSTNIQSAISLLAISRGSQKLLASGSSIFLELSFLPTSDFGSGSCTVGYKGIVELRGLGVKSKVNKDLSVTK